MTTSGGVRRMVHGSQLGPLVLVATDGALSGVFFPDHRVQPARAEVGELVETGTDDLLDAAAAQLDEYFEGNRTDFDLPLAPASPNELDPRVWQVLQQIPFGETTTYGEIARELGNANLAQPVGGAVGRNPLGIVIPCHRVVGANGQLTGFAGGEGRKVWLLDHEAFVVGRSLVPPQPFVE